MIPKAVCRLCQPSRKLLPFSNRPLSGRNLTTFKGSCLRDRGFDGTPAALGQIFGSKLARALSVFSNSAGTRIASAEYFSDGGSYSLGSRFEE